MNIKNGSKLFPIAAAIAFAINFCSLTAPTFADNSVELPPAPAIMVVSTPSMDGFRIKEYKGIVRGVTVREPGPMSNIKANLKSVVGGRISPYARLCDTARQQAMEHMVARAQAMGANAVVSFRYDCSSFGDSDDMVTEVVCYGTAVVIEADHGVQKAASAPSSED